MAFFFFVHQLIKMRVKLQVFVSTPSVTSSDLRGNGLFIALPVQLIQSCRPSRRQQHKAPLYSLLSLELSLARITSDWTIQKNPQRQTRSRATVCVLTYTERLRQKHLGAKSGPAGAAAAGRRKKKKKTAPLTLLLDEDDTMAGGVI